MDYKDFTNTVKQIKKYRGTNKVTNTDVDYVFFKLNYAKMEIAWTDFDVFYKSNISYAGGLHDKDVCIKIKLKQLEDICTMLDDDFDVYFNHDTNKLTFGDFTIKVESDSGKVFDLIAQITDTTDVKTLVYDCDINKLKTVSKQSVKKEGMYVTLAGINFKNNTIACTDGNRICRAEMKMSDSDIEVTIPSHIIDNCLSDKYCISLAYRDNKVKYVLLHRTLNLLNEVIAMSVLGCQYPKYEQIYFNSAKMNIEINSKKLATVLNKCKKIKPYNDKVTLTFVSDEKVEISCVKDEMEFKDEIEYKLSKSEDKIEHISFNVNYLLDLVKLDENLNFKINGHLHAVRIPTKEYDCLVMPMS